MPPAGKIMVKEAGGQKSNTFEKDERDEMFRGAGRIGLEGYQSWNPTHFKDEIRNILHICMYIVLYHFFTPFFV